MTAAGWIIAALLAAAWLGVALHQARHWQHLRSVLRHLAGETRPHSFIFQGSPRFAALSADLEKIAERQRQLRRQVSEEEFYLLAVLASMIEGVAIVDLDHRIQIVNDSFTRMFQLDADPVGRTLLGALRDAQIEELTRAALRADGPQTRELTLPRKKPPPLQLTVSATPLRSEAGETTGAVLVIHDISRLKQLEDVRREFVANVSHELRTPLAIFQGYLEGLIDEPGMEQSEREATYAVLKKHSQRLNALLEDVLTLARLEAKKDILEPAAIKLAPFAAQLLADWERKLAAKNIAASLDIPAGLRVFADPLRLEQVCGNLLDNAVKYTDPGGRLSLTAAPDGGQVAIRVTDTGIGIPPADLSHVFERFYRVERARSREGGGTGLGLAIVKHIVQLHGGTVSAESRYGQGTTITVRLPQAGDTS